MPEGKTANLISRSICTTERKQNASHTTEVLYCFPQEADEIGL